MQGGLRILVGADRGGRANRGLRVGDLGWRKRAPAASYDRGREKRIAGKTNHRVLLDAATKAAGFGATSGPARKSAIFGLAWRSRSRSCLARRKRHTPTRPHMWPWLGETAPLATCEIDLSASSFCSRTA